MKSVVPTPPLGGGEMSNSFDTMDWSQTALGPRDHWPEALRVLVHTMLACPLPMYISWGPDRLFLYNDAWRPLLGAKHPQALGRPCPEVWAENWSRWEPLFQAVAQGRSCLYEDMPINDRFFTLSFQSLLDHQGLQCIGSETTERVHLRRRAEHTAQHLDSYFREAPLGTAIMEGPKHVFQYSNPLYNQMVGHRPLIGLTIREAFPDLEGQPFFSILDEVYRTGQPYIAQEALVSLQDRQGNKADVFLDFIYAPRLNARGEVEGISVLFVDVTEKVNARRYSETRSQELTQLANSMPQIVWSCEASGATDYCNDRWFDYTGEARGPWVIALHPKDRKRVEQLWEDCISSGLPLFVEARLRHIRTQAYRWFQIQVVPWRNPEGKVSRWYGSATDIHELRLLTEQLTEAREKFELIFKNTRSALALCKDDELILERVNDSFAQLFPERDFLGRPLLEACPEIDAANFLQKLQDVHRTGVAFRGEELSFDFASMRYFDLRVTRLDNVDEETDGILLDMTEVTERVLSRRKIEESEEWLRLAMRAARIGIWDLDHHSQRVSFSERSSEMFGLEQAGTFELEHLLTRIHPDDVPTVKRALEMALDPEGSGEYDVVHRIVLADGAIRWVSVFGQARPGSRLTGSLLDITAEVEAHQEVNAARELADNANSAKSAFLANMSHEIRSPLGAIMGFVELMKDPDLEAEDGAEYLNVIERNSQQLLRIIDDILDLSKVEAGKMLVENLEFPLPDLLADFASIMGFKARENGIDFMLRAASPLPDHVVSDATRIRQILNNIVGNAIKFTRKGFVELLVSYEAPRLRFQVRDTGIGITPEQASRLFQAFGQADVSTTRRFGGTGLGLILTRKLAQMLGGDFWLETSEPGRGSVFVATIAVEEASGWIRESQLRYTTNPARVIGGETPPLEGMRVLVVEDSPDNQKLLMALLSRFGATVEIADDGWKGMNRAMEGDFHIVLMDVQMPRMDGLEAVQRLRAQNFQRPIIALTAHAMQEERERCLRAGYTDFLSKPIDRTRLLDMMQHQVTLH